jgi:hypothetical protein
VPKDPKLTVHSTDSSNMLTLRDNNPGIEEHHSRAPEHVDHEVDFRAMRYRRTALFRNDDPWAESDTSQASQGFLVRRTDSGAWEAQLVTRNSVTLDTPGEWERVPQWLATAWEEAWRRRSR